MWSRLSSGPTGGVIRIGHRRVSARGTIRSRHLGAKRGFGCLSPLLAATLRLRPMLTIKQVSTPLVHLGRTEPDLTRRSLEAFTDGLEAFAETLLLRSVIAPADRWRATSLLGKRTLEGLQR